MPDPSMLTATQRAALVELSDDPNVSTIARKATAEALVRLELIEVTSPVRSRTEMVSNPFWKGPRTRKVYLRATYRLTALGRQVAQECGAVRRVPCVTVGCDDLVAAAEADPRCEYHRAHPNSGA